MSMEKAIKAIKENDRFLIISHIGLEGDSIGSQSALKILLKKLGKKSVVVNGGEVSPQYEFLDIKNDIILDLNTKIDYDAVIVLDCPVVKRIGKASKFLKKDKILINIDHHISNTDFGDVNWIEPHASSCGEMVYWLYKSLDIPIDKRAALFIYVAILTDTGSFAYECTTSRTHTIVAELIKKGLKPDFIYQVLYENKTLAEVRLLQDALSKIRLINDGKIAYTHVSKDALGKLDLSLEATEGFINYARAIKGVKVAIIFLENPLDRGYIQISFRSKGEVNVDKLASVFGGGGHKNASGCLIEGGLRDVMKKVLDKVKNRI